MKVSDAIEQLREIERKAGDVDVYGPGGVLLEWATVEVRYVSRGKASLLPHEDSKEKIVAVMY